MKANRVWQFVTGLSLLCMIGACVTAKSPAMPASSAQKSNLTPGMIKASVVEGETTQNDILSRFGAPNIITRDRDGREVWTYDRQYTATAAEVAAWQAGWAAGAGGVGTNEPIGAMGGASGQSAKTSAVSQTSSGTMTWMITFDEHDVVDKHKLNWTSF